MLAKFSGQAQSLGTLTYKQGKGKSQAVAFAIYVPAGVFSKSHIGGAGIDYSWSRHQFGRNISGGHLIAFMLNGGINYYVGKRVTTAGYDFRYGGYTNIYAMPGILCHPLKKVHIALTAGPALNIYKRSVNAGIGINFFTNYYLSENIAIGPGLIYKKHTNTDALWAGGLRASYNF
ncbi:MAG: hypothetical protein ACXWWD_03295 [Chitinophagaceae bacterium]